MRGVVAKKARVSFAQDENGWLYLTGRSKEMINRGGETINPHEVEPALVKVPGIEVAICFSAPHQALGECIAAALVLKEGLEPEQVQPKDILRYTEKELSDVMQPEVFVYLPKDLLPTTATKKFIRAGLAQKLGLCDLLSGQGGAFMYQDGGFTPCDFILGSKLRDSLGQLRDANYKELTEQRIKDALFGVGILQVMIKHWYEGKYEPDDASGGEPNVYNDLIFLTQRAHCLSNYDLVWTAPPLDGAVSPHDPCSDSSHLDEVNEIGLVFLLLIAHGDSMCLHPRVSKAVQSWACWGVRRSWN